VAPPEIVPRRHAFHLDSGLTLAADVYGDPGAPPVVFLHGGGQTRHAWGGSAQALAAAGYLAIALDLRGHGESAWAPDGDYRADAFVRDLAGVLAQIERPAFVVGASLGGITAMMTEAAAPVPCCRGIVLVDVTPRLEIGGVMRILGFMSARPDGFASIEEAADVVAAFLPHRPRPRDLSGLAKNLRLHADGRHRWHWDPALMETWNPERFDPEEGRRLLAERLAAARRLRVPVLLVRGRMSDVVSEEGVREFLEAVPAASFVDLKSAGHMVAGDRNDAFTEAVLVFVERETRAAELRREAEGGAPHPPPADVVS
jgi:pimeloyl-ACP methyl ester carboxylesterase